MYHDDEFRRRFFSQLPLNLAVSRAIREIAIDKWGEDSDHIDDMETAALLVFEHIDIYQRAAARAMERMMQASQRTAAAGADGDNWATSGAETHHQASTEMEVELHFYLTAWATIARSLETFKDKVAALRFRAVSATWKKHGRELTRYKELRNTMEHFEKRLPGGEMADRFIHPLDPDHPSSGKLIGWKIDYAGVLRAGNTEADITPRSLDRLNTILSELRSESLAESLDIIVSHSTPDGRPFIRTEPPWALGGKQICPLRKSRRRK